MSWKLSMYRAGELVQIRSKEEILATLDQNGCIDGMPFMPEMLQYCGNVVRVSAVAHKTCETARRTWKARRLNAMVHLAGLRCDGSAHGGCQAACNLFWRDEWLAKPGETTQPASGRAGAVNEKALYASTMRDATSDEIRYACQATMVTDASAPLQWWNPRQYVRDIRTRNFPLAHVARVIWLAILKHWARNTPRGYRLANYIRGAMHRRLTGREVPDFLGKLPLSTPTPTGRIDLQVGERVRIKSKPEIEATLDTGGKNRGLAFDVEMSPYCGREATVEASVTHIIDEETGKMRVMKQPCIRLRGVVCQSRYSDCRLMCPRAIPSYWREIWLERSPAHESATRSHPREQEQVSELVG
jgi:hypothetical protein